MPTLVLKSFLSASLFIIERGALPPARLERCWFEFVVLMPVGSGDLFGIFILEGVIRTAELTVTDAIAW